MCRRNLIKVILIVLPATLLLTGCSLNVMQGGVSGGLFVVLLSLLGAGCRQGLEGESQMATFLRYMAASYGVNTKSSSNPEIEVRIGGAHVKSGEGVYDLGSAKRNELDYTKTVLIQNTGNDYLVIDSVEITGENGDQFHAEYEDKAIPPGENDSFELLYTPSKDVSSHTAQVIIHNNDEDESAFAISVSASTILSCALTRDWTQPIDLSQDRTATGEGFRVIGTNPDDGLGVSLAIGDTNLDGIDDIMVSAPEADTDTSGIVDTGEVYVLYGKSSESSDIHPFSEDLIAGGLGFKIQFLNPMSNSYQQGAIIENVRDVNGDNLDDYLIYQTGPSVNGQLFLIFGNSGTIVSDLDLNTFDTPPGVEITLGYPLVYGEQIAALGDINGDGFNDFAISSHQASYNGNQSGSVWVVYGKADSKWSDFVLADVAYDSSSGFRVDGAAENDLAGKVVSGAGDFNGDGLNDLLIGATQVDNSGSNQGAAYVLYGRKDKPSILNLGGMGDGEGLKIYSNGTDNRLWGQTARSAGDLNQDQFDDVILGSKYSGGLVIIYGKKETEDREIYNEGVFLSGVTGSNTKPYPTRNIGDVNGDGLDDILVGDLIYNANVGRIVLLFGREGGISENYNFIDLPDAGMGAIFNGYADSGGTPVQAGFNVSGGDINGDGCSDVLITALQGEYGVGVLHVIYGADPE